MVKHGLSHAGAALTCAVSAGMLAKLLVGHLPSVVTMVEVHLVPLIDRLGIPVRTEVVLHVIPIIGLGFLWGAAFQVLNRGGTP